MAALLDMPGPDLPFTGSTDATLWLSYCGHLCIMQYLMAGNASFAIMFDP